MGGGLGFLVFKVFKICVLDYCFDSFLRNSIPYKTAVVNIIP